jgi:hypothetical protein
MTRYLILGAGYFGRRALKELVQINPHSYFIVIDQQIKSLDSLRAALPVRLERVAVEGISFLEIALNSSSGLDWIIPAIPRHVAFEWLWQRRPADSRWQVDAVPDRIKDLAPESFQGTQKELFLSMADSICPDNCPEPQETCLKTGRPRQGSLYQLLEEVKLPDYQIKVIRSQQLAPGVGGYPSSSLRELWNWVQANSGRLLIATACRCHGVVHGLSKP